MGDTLSPLELALLGYCAEGFGELEVATRLGVRREEVSVIRNATAEKIAARIASAHPFQIRELV
jgi:hypothetical protein